MNASVIHGDCRVVLPTMEAASADCVCCDPPYEIGMMGQSWDRRGVAFDPVVWSEIARVVKPGGWLVSFGGRRTWHRMVCAAEDAGLDIRDSLMWLYTTGNVTAKHTTLKPAWEPIMLAQIPVKGSLARAVEETGVGYLDIDACRLPYLDDADLKATLAKNPGRTDTFASVTYGTERPQQSVNLDGRHPSNVFIDEDVADEFGRDRRFFLTPKASRKERDAGLSLDAGLTRNAHPCVKPIELMRWLVRLVCPLGGLVLDPFAGSGSTGCAALMEGRSFIGVESEEIYVQTARLRLDHWRALAAEEIASC